MRHFWRIQRHQSDRGRRAKTGAGGPKSEEIRGVRNLSVCLQRWRQDHYLPRCVTSDAYMRHSCDIDATVEVKSDAWPSRDGSISRLMPDQSLR
jgi:hypothetical protein